MAYIQVAYEKKGKKFTKVLKCKTVDEQEYNKMQNEVNEHEQKELEENALLKKEINDLKDEINGLKHEIKVLKGEEE